MQYAGILVLVRPEAWAGAVAALEALDGVEVHHREEATRRVVVVVEAKDATGRDSALGQIRSVPGVVVAEPAYHYDTEGTGTRGAEREREEDAS